jgi:hypothetical protein
MARVGRAGSVKSLLTLFERSTQQHHGKNKSYAGWFSDLTIISNRNVSYVEQASCRLRPISRVNWLLTTSTFLQPRSGRNITLSHFRSYRHLVWVVHVYPIPYFVTRSSFRELYIEEKQCEGSFNDKATVASHSRDIISACK